MATVSARTSNNVAAADDYYAEPRGAGWVAYAAIMLGLAGTWNAFDGILALANSKVFVGHTAFVFSNLHTWGWIVLFLGIAQIAAAAALMGGSQVARWFGIAVASVNAIGQLMYLPAYPWWGLAMFTVDMLIIYGLAVYGGRETTASM
jgi:hypothetical protein